jgi:shikimate kinase
MYRPIFLIGFMGSGKSTVGRRLADQLGFRFIDTDTFIETRFRQRIVDMFAALGEEIFRRRERIIIEELMSMEDTVFATGGGLPCHGDTMELLNASGETVYFRCSAQILSLRLELCKRTRPTIRDKSGEELLSFTQETLAHREPIYSQAKHTFDIDLIDTPEKEEAFACQLAQHKPLLVESDWG